MRMRILVQMNIVSTLILLVLVSACRSRKQSSDEREIRTGGGGGTGAENALYHSAWFPIPSDSLSPSTGLSGLSVSYCIVKDGFEGRNLDAMLHVAYSRWQTYIFRNYMPSLQDQLSVQAFTPLAPTPITGDCFEPGSLVPRADLTLLFGHRGKFGSAIQSMIDAEAKRYDGAPAALTSPFERRSSPYTAKIGAGTVNGTKEWTKGFIWINGPDSYPDERAEVSPLVLDWKQDYEIEAILTHEIGHTLGIAHVEGTVMERLYAKQIANSNDALGSRKFRLSQIDLVKAIYTPRGKLTFPGLTYLNPPYEGLSVRNLLDMQATDPIPEMQAYVEADFGQPPNQNIWSMRLIYNIAGRGKIEFPLELSEFTSQEEDVGIFRIAGHTGYFMQSRIFSGFITTVKGRKIRIFVMYNVDPNSPLVIQTDEWGAGKKGGIFFSESPYAVLPKN